MTLTNQNPMVLYWEKVFFFCVWCRSNKLFFIHLLSDIEFNSAWEGIKALYMEYIYIDLLQILQIPDLWIIALEYKSNKNWKDEVGINSLVYTLNNVTWSDPLKCDRVFLTCKTGKPAYIHLPSEHYFIQQYINSGVETPYKEL